MAKTRGNLATIAIVVSFVTLAGAAALGWWNFWGTRMVSRGNIREACYLAIAFDDYFEQNGKAPSQEDIESLPSRLKFLRIQDGRYLFSCGQYGRDTLIILHMGNGKFDFYVNGSEN